MKVFTTLQISDLDRYTIENEPIDPIDLMERASCELAGWILSRYLPTQRLALFAGPGNNGGDALAVSRILALHHFSVDVFIPDTHRSFSECFLINLERLKKLVKVSTINWRIEEELPELADYDLIIDGLYGSGLTRPLSGFSELLVRHLNNSGIPIISIDIPSGLMGEENSGNNPMAIIRAQFTLTLQFPKLCFFLPENSIFTGTWVILPIGLHPLGIEQKETPWHYSDPGSIACLLKKRDRFSHKGTFGHALLVAGSFGKMGAAVLAAKGCLRSGVGLLTVHLPRMGNQIMQTALPEAMVSLDDSENLISGIPLSSGYKSIGIGPGIGIGEATANAFKLLMENHPVPMVIDADALNILSGKPELIRLLPADSILTPHPKEFERLAGVASSDFERLSFARRFAQVHHVILVLKGAYTAIAFPDGSCWFNSTGNPGMATGGSGDLLTGILTGLLAQGYSPAEAALLGVYLHGLSGDLALEGSSEEALIAGDIADHLGKAFSALKNDPHFGKAKKKVQF
jgi:NAD(P)H-hydrate epimerase